MEGTRRKYSREFKERAVGMLENSGKSGREIEGDLGIGRGMIYRWRAQLLAEGGGIRAFPGNGNPRDEELTRLRRELAVVKEEREILRKALAIFSKAKR
jgi:transposase